MSIIFFLSILLESKYPMTPAKKSPSLENASALNKHFSSRTLIPTMRCRMGTTFPNFGQFPESAEWINKTRKILTKNT
jgi:hypothetical protein